MYKYEVEAIFDKKVQDSKKKQMVFYLIMWKNNDKTTWAPEEHLQQDGEEL